MWPSTLFIEICLWCLSAFLPQARARIIGIIPIDAWQNDGREIDCGTQAFIRIAAAYWSATGCLKSQNRVADVGRRCNNKRKCRLTPTRDRCDGENINLGNLCPGYRMRLTGFAECHNPCLTALCGPGTCTPLGWKSHRCTCDQGFVTTWDVTNARCVPDLCLGNPCGSARCVYVGGAATYTCACPRGSSFDEKSRSCIHPRRGKTIKLDAWENRLQVVECGAGELIHITEAHWSGFSDRCRVMQDRKLQIQHRCENKRVCRYIPHWILNAGLNVALGDPCPGIPEALRGTAECWNPCKGEDCGDGSCSPVSWNNYRCICRPGSVNSGATAPGKCAASPCSRNPCGPGKCEVVGGNRTFRCICPVGHKFLGGTCQAYDSCTDVPSRCPAGASCSNGVGRAPTCACPQGQTLQGRSCAAVDACATGNGGCPPTAKCTNGVGRAPSCVCQDSFELKNGKCEAVDRCRVNNGGCDKQAKCTDGKGKTPTCTCPNSFDLVGGKCVRIDRCAIDNGGCDENARCIDRPEGEPTCGCKEGFTEIAKQCMAPGAFQMPELSSVKVEMTGVTGWLKLTLGKCLVVGVNVTSGAVRVEHKKHRQYGNFPPRSLEGHQLTLLNVRGKDTMSVYFFGQRKGGLQIDHSKVLKVKYDASCAIPHATLEGGFPTDPLPAFYATDNIVAFWP